MVTAEHVGLQVIGFAQHLVVDGPKALERFLVGHLRRHAVHGVGKQLYQHVHVLQTRGFVHRQSDPAGLVVVEVHAGILGHLAEILQFQPIRQTNLQRVEELRVLLIVAVRLQQFAQVHRFAVDMFCNLADAFRTVIDCVEARHHRAQRLSRTDVRRGLLAFDMLLARLQGQTVRRLVVRVFAQTDDTSRHVALELVLSGHITRRRTAETHRQTETLGRAADDVSAP